MLNSSSDPPESANGEPLKLRRRSRLVIYLDILSAVERVKLKYGLAKMTKVQYQVNVPYDRFKTYIDELIRLGLVEWGDQLSLTERGQAYVLECNRFVDFLESLGILGGSGPVVGL